MFCEKKNMKMNFKIENASVNWVFVKKKKKSFKPKLALKKKCGAVLLIANESPTILRFNYGLCKKKKKGILKSKCELQLGIL